MGLVRASINLVVGMPSDFLKWNLNESGFQGRGVGLKLEVRLFRMFRVDEQRVVAFILSLFFFVSAERPNGVVFHLKERQRFPLNGHVPESRRLVPNAFVTDVAGNLVAFRRAGVVVNHFCQFRELLAVRRFVDSYSENGSFLFEFFCPIVRPIFSPADAAGVYMERGQAVNKDVVDNGVVASAADHGGSGNALENVALDSAG